MNSRPASSSKRAASTRPGRLGGSVELKAIIDKTKGKAKLPGGPVHCFGRTSSASPSKANLAKEWDAWNSFFRENWQKQLMKTTIDPESVRQAVREGYG